MQGAGAGIAKLRYKELIAHPAVMTGGGDDWQGF